MKGIGYILNDLLETAGKKVGIKVHPKVSLFVTVLLLPVIILLGILLIISVLLWNTVAMLGYSLTGTAAKIETEGLRLTSKIRGRQKILFWDDIREIRQLWKPPFVTHQAVLHSGDLVAIDFVDNKTLETALLQRNIPLVKAFAKKNKMAS